MLAFTTQSDDCKDGELQLVGGEDSDGTRQGRLEICFNRAWGTVCNESFSYPDARTACNQLVGFEREGSILEMIVVSTLVKTLFSL